jgi:amino acid transporter
VALGVLVPSVDRSVWIVGMVAFTLTVNWFGVTVTTRANFIAVGFQVALLVLLLVLGTMALMRGHGAGGLTFAPFYTPAGFEIGAIFAATSICINSFLGFDAISTLSEEVKGGDRRLVGRAIMGVLVISGTFFVVVAWVLGNLMRGLHIEDPSAAAYEMTALTIGTWASIALAWGYATLIGFSNALPMQVGVARVLYAMGRDRQLPTILARVHPKYHTPYIGMIVTALISLVVAIAMRNRLDDLATTVNFGALSGFLLLHVSVLVRFGIRDRSRRWFAHWLSPLLGIAVVLGVFSGMGGLAIRLGFVWLAVGLVWGAVLHRLHRDEMHVEL